MQALYRDPYQMFFSEKKHAIVPSKANVTKVKPKSYFEKRAKNIIDRHTKTAKSSISKKDYTYTDWPSMSNTKKNLNIKEPNFSGSYRKNKALPEVLENIDDDDVDVDIINTEPHETSDSDSDESSYDYTSSSDTESIASSTGHESSSTGHESSSSGHESSSSGHESSDSFLCLT